MKVKLKATGIGPDYYDLSQEMVNDIDLSVIEHGDQFIRTSEMQSKYIRDAWRDSTGELHVVLHQVCGPGHYSGMDDFVDADNYDPEAIYVTYHDDRAHAGQPWVMTKRGKVDPRNNEVLNNE